MLPVNSRDSISPETKPISSKFYVIHYTPVTLSFDKIWSEILVVSWNKYRVIRNDCRGLTTCNTQYTWDRSICVCLFTRTTLQVFVTYLTGALYMRPLWFYKHQHDNRVRSKLSVACQRWWFPWRFWFVPSVPWYLREEEEHKPDPWHNPIERNHMGLHLENEVAVVKIPTIISNNPVYHLRVVTL